MHDDLPSGAEILAMYQPSQLFGEALGDGRAVRRRWARIARTFRDSEPEVFQHARRLFEAARDVGVSEDAHPVSAESVSAPALGVDLEVVDGSEAVGQGAKTARSNVPSMVARSDYEGLARVVEFDPGAIAGQASMSEVLSLVVLGLGPDLTTSQVLAVERELSHELLDVSPGEEARIHRGLSDAAMVRRMRTDADIPKPITALVEACRVPVDREFVAAMNRIVVEVPTPDLHAALTVLDLRYSTAWNVVERAIARFVERSQSTEAVPVPPSLVELFLHRRGLSEVCFMGGLVTAMLVATVLGLVVAWLVFGRLPMAEDDPLTAVFVAPGAIAVGLSLVVGFVADATMKRRTLLRERDEIHALADTYTLFVPEVCLAIWHAVEPSRQGPELQSRLHAIHADPRWLFKLWSKAHASRVLS